MSSWLTTAHPFREQNSPQFQLPTRYSNPKQNENYLNRNTPPHQGVRLPENSINSSEKTTTSEDITDEKRKKIYLIALVLLIIVLIAVGIVLLWHFKVFHHMRKNNSQIKPQHAPSVINSTSENVQPANSNATDVPKSKNSTSKDSKKAHPANAHSSSAKESKDGEIDAPPGTEEAGAQNRSDEHAVGNTSSSAAEKQAGSEVGYDAEEEADAKSHESEEKIDTPAGSADGELKNEPTDTPTSVEDESHHSKKVVQVNLIIGSSAINKKSEDSSVVEELPAADEERMPESIEREKRRLMYISSEMSSSMDYFNHNFSIILIFTSIVMAAITIQSFFCFFYHPV